MTEFLVALQWDQDVFWACWLLGFGTAIGCSLPRAITRFLAYVVTSSDSSERGIHDDE